MVMKSSHAKKDTRIKTTVTRIILFLVLIIVILIIFSYNYRLEKANETVLKSRYTFSVTIDSDGNVLSDYDTSQTEDDDTQSEFDTDLSLNQIADIWVTEFTNQYTQKNLTWSKALKNVKIYKSTTLSDKNSTALVSFSATLKDSTTEYFSSWDGVLDDGRMEFEWVVIFQIEAHDDNTATIYVSGIETPEDYGIAQYNQNLQEDVNTSNESATTSSSSTLTAYSIKNDTLSVTFDAGEKYSTVPVDCSNLPLVENSTTQLMDGSYSLNTYKGAFLYGGRSNGTEQIPVTLIYTDDKGANWITCEIDDIYDADYYYVNFFDEDNGVIVIGYTINSSEENSRIYTTSDGGETWVAVGNGPLTSTIKGVNFIENNIGFFSYDYVDGMDTNLYMTTDGGRNFSPVVLEAQELDSTAANSSTTSAATTAASTENATTAASQTTSSTEGTTASTKLEWKDVYKEALVPIYDTDGKLTVYLTQGSDGVYNDGKTAAKYESTDKGLTWKYVGQLEISSK